MPGKSQLKGSTCSPIIFPRLAQGWYHSIKKKITEQSQLMLYTIVEKTLLFSLANVCPVSFCPGDSLAHAGVYFISLEGLLALTFSTGISVSPSRYSIFLLSVLSLTTNTTNFLTDLSGQLLCSEQISQRHPQTPFCS